MDKFTTPDLITLFAVIVLGATGTYLLLPHRHGLTKPKLAHQIGFVLAALAVLAFTLFWKAHTDYVTRAFFYAFAFSAVFCSILTITSRDPIHSALWFAGVVLATSGLFLLSGAQFLAAGTVIVYAGAIIVTFLFVIMLAQKEGRASYDRMARSPFWATFASFLLLFGLIYSLLGIRALPSGKPALVDPLVRASNRLGPDSKSVRPNQSIVLHRALPPTSQLPETTAVNPDGKGPSVAHVASLGGTLYTEHLVTVELAGALLFAALIGALAIATPRAPIRPSSSDVGPKAGTTPQV